MQIENMAELAEEIYWLVLKEFNKDNLNGGYIEFENSFLGTTQNTEKGTELYMSIEESIKKYMEDL
jgi:hypothetical protein